MKILTAMLIVFGFVSERALASDLTSDMSQVEARAFHDALLTLDTHIDIGRDYATVDLDPGRFTRAQVDLPKMRAGGLDAGMFIVFTSQGMLDDEGYAAARNTAEEKYQAIDRMIRAYPDEIAQARTADDIIRIASSGRLVALIGIENAYPLGPSVKDVPLWAERGAVYASITHFGNNQFGDSSNPRADRGDRLVDDGLTDLGKELVEALNDHGIMVDISHVGKKTGLEAMALSRAPVIASHSGARAVHDHPRNLDDEQLRAIRDSGSVAQMVAYRSYVADIDPEMQAAVGALLEELNLRSLQGRAEATPETFKTYASRIADIRKQHTDVTLDQFLDHVDHAVRVAGIDHVGLSGDFDGGGGVQGWNNASESPNVTLGLLRRGYSQANIAKLWGGNVLRVMRANEAIAAKVHR